MTRLDKIHKLLEVTGNSFSDEDMLYVLSRLEQAEELLYAIRDNDFAIPASGRRLIREYFSARAGEGEK